MTDNTSADDPANSFALPGPLSPAASTQHVSAAAPCGDASPLERAGSPVAPLATGVPNLMGTGPLPGQSQPVSADVSQLQMLSAISADQQVANGSALIAEAIVTPNVSAENLCSVQVAAAGELSGNAGVDLDGPAAVTANDLANDSGVLPESQSPAELVKPEESGRTHQPMTARQVVRQLAAAEGFLELELPTYSLSSLDRVTSFGPFEAIGQLLRGEALRMQRRFVEAVAPLSRAAELFPAPYSQRAWASLALCYREIGLAELAADADAKAIAPPRGKGGRGDVVVQVVMGPIFGSPSGHLSSSKPFAGSRHSSPLSSSDAGATADLSGNSMDPSHDSEDDVLDWEFDDGTADGPFGLDPEDFDPDRN